MPIGFDHLALPVRDPEASARHLGAILGLEPGRDGPDDEFWCLWLTNRSQILFTVGPPRIEAMHFALRVSPAEFPPVVQRLSQRHIAFGNDPEGDLNGLQSDPLGGAGRVYFRDLDGHLLEVCA